MPRRRRKRASVAGIPPRPTTITKKMKIDEVNQALCREIAQQLDPMAACPPERDSTVPIHTSTPQEMASNPKIKCPPVLSVGKLSMSLKEGANVRSLIKPGGPNVVRFFLAISNRWWEQIEESYLRVDVGSEMFYLPAEVRLPNDHFDSKHFWLLSSLTSHKHIFLILPPGNKHPDAAPHLLTLEIWVPKSMCQFDYPSELPLQARSSIVRDCKQMVKILYPQVSLEKDKNHSYQGEN